MSAVLVLVVTRRVGHILSGLFSVESDVTFTLSNGGSEDFSEDCSDTSCGMAAVVDALILFVSFRAGPTE